MPERLVAPDEFEPSMECMHGNPSELQRQAVYKAEHFHRHLLYAPVDFYPFYHKAVFKELTNMQDPEGNSPNVPQ